MTASAQWTTQCLNDHAVTDGQSSERVVLHDGGGAWEGSTENTAAAAFDVSTASTFYNAALAQGAWAGFELQSPKLITRVRYTGRREQPNRVTGVQIQGANTADFSDAVTLWTLPQPPANWDATNTWLEAVFPTLDAVTNTFTFVRFYCPLPNSYGGNFTRMEFYGADPLDSNAPAPPAPVLTFEGCINWRMNLCWESAPATAILYEVQRKIAHENAFAHLAYILAASGEQHILDTSLLLYQDTEYRIRAFNNPEKTSAWVTATGLARNGAGGQWFGTQGSYNNDGMTGDKAFDGNVMTFFNAPNASNGIGTWTGLDFGSEKMLAGLRFTPRHGDYGNTANRMTGGWFELADNRDFVNATTVHTIASAPPSNVVTEAVFPQPVAARYARYCSPNGGWGNVAEVEFIQELAAPPPPKGLSAAALDFTDQYAVLTWTPLDDLGSLVSSVLVYRATSPGGPYDLITPEGLSVAPTGWADTSVTLGVCYYYKIASLLNTGASPIIGKMSSYVIYATGVRIERDENDLTQIKPGMSLLGMGDTYENNPEWEVYAMFDNSTDTFVNIDSRNPAIGVNLGKPYHIHFMRHAARPDAPEGIYRLNGVELRGSNNPDYTSDFTRLATFADATAHQFIAQPTVNRDAFQYVFMQRPDADQFHGNIAELELYGWDPDAGSPVFRAPLSASLTLQNDGIRMDWETGNQQDFYRVQRSTDGGETWTDLLDTPNLTFTDTAPPVGQHTLYRIAAVRMDNANETFAYSDDYPIIPYLPGNGTGLTAAYYTNYATVYNPSEGLAGTFVEPAPDWNIAAAATPIRPDIPSSGENIRIVWYGKLIVPFTGNWTLYATSDDGVAVSINGVCVINNWISRGAATDQATVPLTAGEHLLRVDYFQGGGVKAMKLEWGGALPRTLIPTTQLLPLPLPAEDGVFQTTGEWQGRTFNNNTTTARLGNHTRDANDSSITINYTGGDMDGSNENFHYVWQPVRGDFAFEAKVDMDIDPLRPNGKAMLMVRNALPVGSPFLSVFGIASTGTPGRFSVKQRIPPETLISDAHPLDGPFINPFYLRVKRVKGTFFFAYREATGLPEPWVPLHEVADTGNAFNRNLCVGMAVCGLPQTSPKMFQAATFSDIRLTRLDTGTLILLK